MACVVIFIINYQNVGNHSKCDEDDDPDTLRIGGFQDGLHTQVRTSLVIYLLLVDCFRVLSKLVEDHFEEYQVFGKLLLIRVLFHVFKNLGNFVVLDALFYIEV